MFVYRVLSGITTFYEERTKRRTYQLALRKQSDAEEIKKWDKELTRAYELFNVREPCFVTLDSVTICFSLNLTLDRHPSRYSGPCCRSSSPGERKY
jgi:hypothetical protein